VEKFTTRFSQLAVIPNAVRKLYIKPYSCFILGGRRL